MPPTDPARFTVRSVEDLIALVPVVIGFEPEESLTLLSFAARPPGRPFHARVDLPPVLGDGSPDPGALAAMVGSLGEPVARHRVSLAALVVHSSRAVLAAEAAQGMAGAIAGRGARGARLLGCVRVHGGRWFPLPGADGPLGRLPDHGDGPAAAEQGVPYDVSLHPFLIQSVVAGRVLHGSRAELAASLDPDPRAVAEVSRQTAGRLSARGAEEEAWARRLVGRAVEGQEPLAARDAARLLHGMRDVRVRDAAWSTMSRESALAQVALWTDLLRRAPDPLVPAPASLLAFAAWLAGDGALAWCALDRAWAADPGYRLAALVAETLERACDPRLWMGDAEQPLPEAAEGASARPPGRVLPGPWAARPSSRGPDRG